MKLVHENYLDLEESGGKVELRKSLLPEIFGMSIFRLLFKVIKTGFFGAFSVNTCLGFVVSSPNNSPVNNLMTKLKAPRSSRFPSDFLVVGESSVFATNPSTVLDSSTR